MVGEGAKRDEDQIGGFRVWLKEAASGVDAAIEEGVGMESKKAMERVGSSKVGNVVIGVRKPVVKGEDGRAGGIRAPGMAEELLSHTAEAGGDGAVIVGSVSRGDGGGGTSVIKVASEEEDTISGVLEGEAENDATGADVVR